MGLFYFEDINKPTPFNAAHALRRLGWQSSSNNYLFSNENFDIPSAVSDAFEHKHQLAEILTQYAPEILPLSYFIDSEAADRVAQNIGSESGPWILKPSLLNNGEGICLFQEGGAVRQHFKHGKYFLGPHVLQRYIHPPHLLAGHKYSFRLFAVYSSNRGVYLYRQGYFNICRQAYKGLATTDLSSHLTNEHFGDDHNPNSHQLPTERVPEFGNIYPCLKQQVQRLFTAYNEAGFLEFFLPSYKVAIFGVDFILDENLRAYLLEVNHGACFPVNSAHPLFTSFYEPFWYAVATNFIHEELASSHRKAVHAHDFDSVLQV